MESDKNFTIIDYLVFVILLAASSSIGIYWWFKDRKTQNNRNYLVGGRDLSVIPVSLSLAASFMSTNQILGSPAEVYMLGSQIYVNMIAFFIAVLLATYVFMPVYYDLELVSINKYLLRRFSSNSVRLAGSLGFIFATVPYMGCVLYGPSLALNSVTPLSMSYSILVVGIICTFYTTIGGIKAVIWTDVIQCALMFLGLLMVIISGIMEFGFYKPFEILNEDNRLIFFNGNFDIHRSDVFYSIFLGTLAGWVGIYCVKQTQIQRYCCLSSKAKARKSLWIHLPITIAIAYSALWCGVIIYTKYRGCDPLLTKEIDRYDQLMPYYVMDTMGHIPGLSGLFIVCVFSGALSTLSSGYNALATVTWDDFLKRYFRNSSERTSGIVTKLVSAFYGVLSIAIAFAIGRLGTVMQASHVLAGCISGPLLALFILGFFFPFVDYVAGLSSIITGFMVCLWIAIGSVIDIRPTIQLPVYADKCSAKIYENYDNKLRYLNLTGNHKDLFKITADNFTLPGSYHPNGLNYLYHMSYWLVPAFGFVITFSLGILIGLIRVYLNKRSFSLPSKNYISPIVRNLFYKKEEKSINLKEFESNCQSTNNKNILKLNV